MSISIIIFIFRQRESKSKLVVTKLRLPTNSYVQLQISNQANFNKKSSFILIMSNENRIKKDKSYIFCYEGAYWASIAQGGNRDLILSSRRLRFYSTDFPSGLWEATTLILFKHGGGSPDGQCRYILIIVFIFVNPPNNLLSLFYLTTVRMKG